MEQSLYSFPFRKKKRYQVPYSVLKNLKQSCQEGEAPRCQEQAGIFPAKGGPFNSGFCCRRARVWAFKTSPIYVTTCIVFTSFQRAVRKCLEQDLWEDSHTAFWSQSDPKVWVNFRLLSKTSGFREMNITHRKKFSRCGGPPIGLPAQSPLVVRFSSPSTGYKIKVLFCLFRETE